MASDRECDDNEQIEGNIGDKSFEFCAKPNA